MTGWGAGQRVRLGILTKVFTTERVDGAIAKHGRIERRRRLLPARLVVYFAWSCTSSRSRTPPGETTQGGSLRRPASAHRGREPCPCWGSRGGQAPPTPPTPPASPPRR
ncbi:transposase domain-containing protein [Streptomyces sp. NPDC096538]|uniref:transposase domain-containing protein n=1 Tax=Streptomyces sp. NPDC096538 TaxID=3155427 RepID=UPI003330891D